MDKSRSYTKLGSTAPYAWFVYLILFDVFSVLNNLFSLFIIPAAFFWILFLVQIIVNLTRLIKGTAKLSLRQIIINVGLLVATFIVVPFVLSILSGK